MSNHIYKKHYNADDTFVIKEHRTDGRIRVVGDDNSGYVAFLAAGNTPEDVAYTPPVIPEIDPELVKTNNIARLWRSASEYQDERLNPSGFTSCAMWAQAGNAKAQANVDWVEALWAEYYTRRASIEAGEEVSFDFESVGELPNGCDVIMAEVNA